MTKTNLSLRFGHPVTVALRSVCPEFVRSPSGQPLAMYTLSDGARLYVPPFAAEKIGNLGLSAGEPFTLVKTKAQNGTVVWSPSRCVITDGEGPLAGALAGALRAAARAEEEALRIGYRMRFTPIDIREMAIALLAERLPA